MSTPPELLLASQNDGKLEELRRILEGLSVSWCRLTPEWAAALPEEGDDYDANARAKAVSAARASGRVAIGDDSGIEVDALDGAPGPLSARYGGADLDATGRNARLLEALRGIPAERRSGRFVCVAAVARPDGWVRSAVGFCSGRIGEAARGERGFGYDPLFLLEGRDVTMAELSPAEKDVVSHRGRAFRALLPEIETALRA